MEGSCKPASWPHWALREFCCAEQLIEPSASVLLAPRAEGAQDDFAAEELIEPPRQDRVANELKMIDGVEPVGVSRMPGDEHQLIVVNTLRRPFQIMLDLRRLAVFVDAEQAEIEIEPRIFKIVRIAAKEGDRLLGSKH